MLPRQQEQQRKEQAAALVFTKAPFKEENIPLRIKQIRFGLQTPQEIVKCGVFHVYERNLYRMPDRAPAAGGVLDPRLGISNKSATCATCGQKLQDCAGHFGYISLTLPVFHIGYFKNTVQLLQCICKSCSRVLLPDAERAAWVRRFRSNRLERVSREALFKKVNEKCKRQKVCPHCGCVNGGVKKASGALKIVHDKYAKQPALFEAYKATFEEACAANEALRPHLGKVADDLNPLRVQALFQRVPDADLDVLDIVGRPENLIVTAIPVPPVAIRPSVDMDGASNEDDISMKLMQIIEVNNLLRQALDKGLPLASLLENWDFLQVSAAMLINADLPGLPPQFQQPGRPMRGFVQRLKGKQGRFRGNLSGKRVDFSGRTVISPDPNLGIHQVCVPIHMATTLTYPERATWPGANFIVYPDGSKWFLRYGDRRKCAAELRPGDTVERHLEDGDVVLFNRQPSLHRVSIMAFRAVVRPGRTLRFNECVCAPFNADFDGDEMNLHVPQTEEARAEAATLMASTCNLATPKNGEILIAATQDFLTAAFQLTSKERFYSRAQFAQLVAYMGDALQGVDLPTAALLKPLELWTGKQVFSVLLRPAAGASIYINLELAEKLYSKGANAQHMCANDGYVAFRNSDLLCGRLGKATLGGGSKGGLFAALSHEASPAAAAAAMGRLAKLASRLLGDLGLSIGIDDVSPRERLQRDKAAMLQRGYADCAALIASFKQGAMQLQPGCNAEQTLETQVTGVLNGIREGAGRLCMETLAPTNGALMMSQCGSKGSPINIAQMVACVGQQSVGGRRCFNGFRERTLPHFPRGDKTPSGKGFVANSFHSGLIATEFWFHTMGGREGLVDTAVKTAETGYMSRRLMKALEDLYAHYDGTTRNAAGGIVQFVYGEDGMDPVAMEGRDGKVLDLERQLAAVCAQLSGSGAANEVPLPAQLEAHVARLMAYPKLADVSEEGGWCSLAFRDDLAAFLAARVAAYRDARARLGLPQEARGHPALEYVAGLAGLTEAQLHMFVRRCMLKYEGKRIDAGSTVGAVGAQSIGEPGTQMTLKTFHFAGVASMNVTLGVPRIKEIINAARAISTPIMKVALGVDKDVKAARIVKGRLERTTLGQVADDIRVVLLPRRKDSCSTPGHPGEVSIHVRLDMAVIQALQLDIDATSVKWSILAAPKSKLREIHVRVLSRRELAVYPPDDSRAALLFNLEALLLSLPQVIVMGIATVERAVIAAEKGGPESGGHYQLVVEGNHLQAVMATPGVKGVQTSTNHVHEIERVLGIEAARSAIISEIKYTMGSHGMSIDDRHTMLLADCMTYRGEILGITRFGIAKMKDSVLHTASFEKTADHLFDAAIHGRVDDVVGVSESIIMGIPMPVGTGIFKLRHNLPLLPAATAAADTPADVAPMPPATAAGQHLPSLGVLHRAAPALASYG